jgi:exodeoxyribonuclease VIII
MSYEHLMIDLETMGRTPTAAIVAIGAVKFDPFEGVSDARENRFYRIVDLDSSIRAGLTVDGSTLSWWLKQSETARAEVARQPRAPLDQALADFAQFFIAGGGHTIVWAQGADFDIAILRVAFAAVNIARPWEYNNVRDSRTIFDAARLLGLPVPKIELPGIGYDHNAAHDATLQAHRVVATFRTLRALRPDQLQLREILAAATAHEHRDVGMRVDAQIPYFVASLRRIAGLTRTALHALGAGDSEVDEPKVTP